MENDQDRYIRLIKTPEKEAKFLPIDEQYDRIRFLTVREVKRLYPSLTSSFSKNEPQREDRKALKSAKQVFTKDWND